MQFNKALQHTIVWKVLNTIISFCINLLIVRMLGPEDSGRFFYGLAILSLLILVLSWSLESGITYYGSRSDNDIGPLTAMMLPVLIVQILASSILLAFIKLPVGHWSAVLFVVSNIAISYCSAVLYVKKKFITPTALLLSVNLILLLILVFAWFTGLVISDPAMVVRSYIISVAVQALLILFFVYPLIKIKDIFSFGGLPLFRNLLGYSSIALISNLLFFLVTRVDYYFVEKYCSAEALGNYVQVSRLGQLLVMVPAMMAAVVFPFTASKENHNYAPEVVRLCKLISLAFIPVVILCLVAGRWFFPWLFGEGFNSMFMAMLFYLPGFFSLSIVTVVAAYLAGKGLVKSNLTATIIALTIVITGDLLFIPGSGINAAAAVSSVAYTACMFYLLWIFRTTINGGAARVLCLRRTNVESLKNER